MKWAEIFYIRDCLKNAYQDIQSVSDINSCYSMISGIPVVVRKRDIKSNYLKSVTRPNLSLLNKGKTNEFPVFSIVSEGDVACLSCGSFSGEDIISKWNLAMYGPMVRVAK